MAYFGSVNKEGYGIVLFLKVMKHQDISRLHGVAHSMNCEGATSRKRVTFTSHFPRTCPERRREEQKSSVCKQERCAEEVGRNVDPRRCGRRTLGMLARVVSETSVGKRWSH